MPTLSTDEATERPADVVKQVKPTVLAEIHEELFPEKGATAGTTASEIAGHIRAGLAAEEIVALGNVVFPEDRYVWYNEEDEKIHYNEEAFGYVEAD